MNSRDLFYWLQGFFEISGDCEVNATYELEFTLDQMDVIKRHIQLVIHDSNADPQVYVLLGMVRAEASRDTIGAFVAEYFEHVIDSQNKDPEKSQAIHDGTLELPLKPSWGPLFNPSPTKIRC